MCTNGARPLKLKTNDAFFFFVLSALKKSSRPDRFLLSNGTETVCVSAADPR